MGKKKSKKAKRKNGNFALILGAIIGGVVLVLVLVAVGIVVVIRYRAPAVTENRPSAVTDKSLDAPKKTADKEKSVVGKTYDQLLLEGIDLMRTVEASLVPVKDAASADKATETIKAEKLKMQRLQQDTRVAVKPTVSEQEKANRHVDTVLALNKGISKGISQLNANVKAGLIPQDSGKRLIAAIREFESEQKEFGRVMTVTFGLP